MSGATKPGGGAVVCDSQCGCQVPCPGGITCRCVSEGAGGGTRGGSDMDDPKMEHKRCSCGEHCGCNPCTCAKSAEITGTGKSNCKCGEACTCATCGAA